MQAVENAVVMEEVAKFAYYTRSIASEIGSIDQHLLDKHFLRKENIGKNADLWSSEVDA